jgi:hypothetical protein
MRGEGHSGWDYVKWLVAPESRMAQLLMVAAYVDIVLKRMEEPVHSFGSGLGNKLN